MIKRKTITTEELCLWVEYYKTHTLYQTITEFHTSYPVIKRIFQENNIKIRSSEEERALAIEHRRDTCLERYGNATYRNIEQRKETCLKKYGVDNVRKSKEVKDKIQEHSKETCLKKYGSEYYTQSDEYKDRIPELLNKAKQTKKERYGNENYSNMEKSKKTKLERYGDPNYSNAEKRKQTCLERYGFDSYSKTEDFKEMLKERKDEITLKIKQHFNTVYGVDSYLSTEEFLVKRDITKKKNHTFNSSLPENRLYESLYTIFKDDVKRQYKDRVRYPFNCDFYIKSLDLFIELNFSWTHGGHPFDVNNKEDIETLNKWKSNNKNYEENAIYTWTDLDVRKLNTFKLNNLNYVILYNEEEMEDLLKILLENN